MLPTLSSGGIEDLHGQALVIHSIPWMQSSCFREKHSTQLQTNEPMGTAPTKTSHDICDYKMNLRGESKLVALLEKARLYILIFLLRVLFTLSCLCSFNLYWISCDALRLVCRTRFVNGLSR
ncbi:hypothetical protein PROFUN_05483 [Planoprotostelium fungivorum]|uniref:Uncharacterized protein n=1 Tax=Planoprotostelium fungivorum TaxID=1890364 RepID=A0A2P6NQV2_9EUKA|nr:hypothetical protein PROFUN_05483 [Planoprotostelium fungivorum]